MVSKWLHGRGVRPHVRDTSALAPYVGPHAVPGRTSAGQLNKLLRDYGMRGDYSADSIVNPWNHPGVMMHEGGHIANFHDQKNFLRRFMRNDDKADAAVSGLSQYTRGVLPFYSQASGVGLAALASKDMGRYAWALPLIGSAPLVGEEGLASLRGLNEIRRQRGMGAALAATPALLKALSTYWPVKIKTVS